MAQKHVDYSWLIAAWVTLPEDAFGPIFRTAKQFSDRLGEALTVSADAVERARRNADALWGSLRGINWRYLDHQLAFIREQGDSVQRVQKPATTLETTTGNCLDLAVLFASLLDRCGMEPGILLVPRHAIVGWRCATPSGEQWEFVDPTLLVNSGFDAARGAGKRIYDEARARVKSSEQNALISAVDRFAILVNINAVKQRYRITPF
jgi:hypothetical protein